MKNSPKFFLIVLFAAVICLSVVSASGQAPIREVLRRMDAYNKSLTTLKAEITMVKVDAVLGEDDPTISTGTVIYAKQPRKEALMRLDWRKPEESIAVVDGEYRVFRPRLEVAYKGSVKNLDKAKPGLNPNAPIALSFLNSSGKDLNARYDVSLVSRNARLSNGVETFQMKLTPKIKTSYKTAELWVDADGMPVQIKLIEQNNDSTTIRLTGSKPNINLKKSDFIITWPAGTKVRKL